MIKLIGTILPSVTLIVAIGEAFKNRKDKSKLISNSIAAILAIFTIVAIWHIF